jgi:hypothetical protein
MTADIDPTDIYCRLKPRAPRRPTARDVLGNLDPRRTCGVPMLDAIYAGVVAGCALVLAALAVEVML